MLRQLAQLIIALSLSTLGLAAENAPLNPLEQLGKKLFFDPRLSQPAGQSCASCHSPEAGFATPASNLRNGISLGADGVSVTPRNAPSISYNIFSPRPKFDRKAQTVIGGLFHDQRATDAVQQAGGPLLNPAEMGNPDEASVVAKLQTAGYADDFDRRFGSNTLQDTAKAFRSLTEALAAYEKSSEVNPFSSKYDAYLRGKVKLTEQEQRGLKLFNSKKAGNCAACHPSVAERGQPPLFTDFSNDNLGLPANKANPFYTSPANKDGAAFIDEGLAGSELARAILLKAKKKPEDYRGKFKVPSLRNVAVTGPYMHNAVFNSLREVMDFYNTACKKGNPQNWPAPEIAATRNCSEMGDLKLKPAQIDDIIVFMGTLTDGYVAGK